MDGVFYYTIISYEADWVSPFGHRRIKASWQLPDDYRGHVRPSSVIKTKVSAVCIVLDAWFRTILRAAERTQPPRVVYGIVIFFQMSKYKL